MKKLIIPLFLFLSLMLLSYSTDNIKDVSFNNRNLPFDSGWKFLRDSVAGAENPSFDDSGWRTLDLPHDWSIENFANSDNEDHIGPCLLYTSDAADEEDSVDLGGRRIIKKK